MLATADKCSTIPKVSKTKDKDGALNRRESDERRVSIRSNRGGIKQDERKSVASEEKRPLSSKLKSKRSKDLFSSGSGSGLLESSASKIIKEPSDLSVCICVALCVSSRRACISGPFIIDPNGIELCYILFPCIAVFKTQATDRGR